MWFCWSKKDVFEALNTHLKEFEFFGCTQEVKDYDEAKIWKNASCDATKGNREYREIEDKCELKNDRPHCTMVGKCFKNQIEKKNMCKFCYRWQCYKEHLHEKTKATCKNRKKQNVCMKFFKQLIDNGKKFDIDKLIERFDSGTKKK